jgi:hypothetical protein
LAKSKCSPGTARLSPGIFGFDVPVLRKISTLFKKSWSWDSRNVLSGTEQNPQRKRMFVVLNWITMRTNGKRRSYSDCANPIKNEPGPCDGEGAGGRERGRGGEGETRERERERERERKKEGKRDRAEDNEECCDSQKVM